MSLKFSPEIIFEILSKFNLEYDIQFELKSAKAVYLKQKGKQVSSLELTKL